MPRDTQPFHCYPWVMATANRDLSVKGLSAFYTPASVADMLAEWLVQSGTERILEPSAGEGALLEAASRRAELIRSPAGVSFVACDINPVAIRAISTRLGAQCETRAIDFLQLDPASTGFFDGVLANPPFLRNHGLDPVRRAVLRERFEISGAAGLWVHFLLHALKFLRPGGRLAFVIPASALFSDYGRAALARVASQFATVEVREIVDRPTWTNGADERGALLLADGFALGTSPLPISSRWTAGGEPAQQLPQAAQSYNRLLSLSTMLGTLGSLSIGAVTGCNRVFLLNEAERRALGIKKTDLRPIISRARHVPGLSIDKERLLELARNNEKTWLLAPRQLGQKGSAIRRRLAQVSAGRRRSTLWFAKRDPWWRVDAGPPSDAIFTYMNDRGPRLVLSTADVSCTNTLHRVRFHDHISQAQRVAASLSLVTTFGQLSAERLGRCYGGGLLKFELKDARQFPILPGQMALEKAFHAADHLLVSGDISAATRVADEALLAPLMGEDWEQAVFEMRLELNARRDLRRGAG